MNYPPVTSDYCHAENVTSCLVFLFCFFFCFFSYWASSESSRILSTDPFQFVWRNRMRHITHEEFFLRGTRTTTTLSLHSRQMDETFSRRSCSLLIAVACQRCLSSSVCFWTNPIDSLDFATCLTLPRCEWEKKNTPQHIEHSFDLSLEYSRKVVRIRR